MVESSSSKLLGTSKDTTSSVSAKPKTASAKPSIRNTSWPRQENPSSPSVPLCANHLRSTSIHHHDTSPKLFSARFNNISATTAAATKFLSSSPLILDAQLLVEKSPPDNY